MKFKIAFFILFVNISLFGAPFKEASIEIKGYKIFILDGMTEGEDGKGYIDESTISSLKELHEQLQETQSLKEKWMFILDSPGGKIGLESPYVKSLIEVGNAYYNIKKEKLSLALTHSCDSLCGIALLELRYNIKQKKLLNKFQLKISKNVRFGFHGAVKLGNWDRENTLAMNKKMVQYGISSQWLKENENYFNSTEITFVSAQKLFDEKSGWVLPNELY